MRASKADKFYMGMLLAIICFCFGLLRIMDEADARWAAERETLIIVEPPTIVAPASQPVQPVTLSLVDVGHASPADQLQYFVAIIQHFTNVRIHIVNSSFSRSSAGWPSRYPARPAAWKWPSAAASSPPAVRYAEFQT